MNITILSGGSGNDSLVTGLKQYYPAANIKVIVNAYDNGKSTGVCRAVTNTLGVSDIRKNHIRMYKACNSNPDARLIEFYDNRYDLKPRYEYEDIATHLDNWNLSELKVYARHFFDNPLAKNYTYKNFSIANIIYSQMYQELGYEQTNSFFCELLGLDDFVILNSFDNVFISARTKSGRIIEDEGEIVDYNNPDDIIMDIIYTTNCQNSSGPSLYGLNPAAIDAVLNADLIIISTGTFWSSIYPTLDYMDFYKYINASNAKKIWAINNEEDGDSFGVTSNQFIEFLNNLRIDLSQFSILENSDAKSSLVEPNADYNIVVYPMGNVKGKHIGELYVKAILKTFYDLKPLSHYDKIIFDFDDTLWSRNEDLLEISIDNIKRLNTFGDKALIVSGNSYISIRKKLSRIYGSGLDSFDICIWADANSTLFKNNNPINYAKDLLIDKSYIKDIVEFLYSLDIPDFEINDKNYPAYIKIKPLSELERSLLVSLIDIKFSDYAIKAMKTGYTTVDIISKNNTKGKLFTDAIDPNKEMTTLYLGDEIDSGNDEDISKLCSQRIRVASVKDTNIILKLLED